jgi:hypothetical protein
MRKDAHVPLSDAAVSGDLNLRRRSGGGEELVKLKETIQFLARPVEIGLDGTSFSPLGESSHPAVTELWREVGPWRADP